MVAAVDGEQLAEAGAGLAAAPMPAPRPPLGDQARFLERELDERVGQRHAVFTPRDVMEVADTEAAIPLAIELQDALDLERRRVAPGGLAALVVEAEGAIGLKAFGQPLVSLLLTSDLSGLWSALTRRATRRYVSAAGSTGRRSPEEPHERRRRAHERPCSGRCGRAR